MGPPNLHSSKKSIMKSIAIATGAAPGVAIGKARS